MIRWWTLWRRERRFRRFRDAIVNGRPVDVIEAVRVTSEWMQTVAEDFHRAGDHTNENDVHAVGRQWAAQVEAAYADDDIETIRATSASATRAVHRIIHRVMDQ